MLEDFESWKVYNLFENLHAHNNSNNASNQNL